jgi:hypothetical protein
MRGRAPTSALRAPQCFFRWPPAPWWKIHGYRLVSRISRTFSPSFHPPRRSRSLVSSLALQHCCRCRSPGFAARPSTPRASHPHWDLSHRSPPPAPVRLGLAEATCQSPACSSGGYILDWHPHCEGQARINLTTLFPACVGRPIGCGGRSLGTVGMLARRDDTRPSLVIRIRVCVAALST